MRAFVQSTLRRFGVLARRYPTIVFLSFALITAGLSHGINMLHYPYYESDEGTYMSQAWSLVRTGELAPYTYWYDHPPFGWMTIALWAKILPNDFFTFGTAIDTGRVLMFIVHLISTVLVFYIIKQITRSNWIALATCLFYSLSPIGIYFHRRVLLDNLMNLWLLASLAVLYRPVLKLRHFALSGLLYAAAFLTKISALFFGPALLYLVAVKKYAAQYTFRIGVWFSVAALAISIYPIFSMLKGEFIPAAHGEHVSLIGSFFFQMNRGNGIPFYKAGSDFMGIIHDLAIRDIPYMFAIVVIIGAGIWAAVRSIHARMLVIGLAVYALFMIRGGVVLNFYIIPFLTFTALLFGVTLHELILAIRQKTISFPTMKPIVLRSAIPASIIAVLFGYYSIGATTKHLTADETSNQRKAILWIKDNLPQDSDIIIDDIMYVELHDPTYRNGKVFSNAEWFYKVSRDPLISDKKYSRNWRRFDYIALTHEMLKNLDRFDDGDISLLAFKNSLPMMKWIDGTTAFIDEQKFITTNGDWAMLYAVNGNTKAQLVDSWKRYTATYIHSYGQVIDDAGVTTSEGQAYAMLQAVWMNDKQTFDGVWDWTQHHLQHRVGDSFISWKWKGDKLIDPVNATDADEDIALALIFASRTWQDSRYKDAALAIIEDMWNKSIIEIQGVYYVLAMNKNDARREGYLFNPSYLSPAAYRIFAQVDQSHDWNKVASDSYTILSNISKIDTLPANWYEVKPTSNTIGPANVYIKTSANEYGYDAFRIFWRVGLDAQWFNNYSAKEYLKKYARFFDKTMDRYGRLPSVYEAKTGEPISWEYSPSVQVGPLIALNFAEDRRNAIQLYDRIIGKSYNDTEKVWENARAYYEYNWVWFGSALFNNNIRNLWEMP